MRRYEGNLPPDSERALGGGVAVILIGDTRSNGLNPPAFGNIYGQR